MNGEVNKGPVVDDKQAGSVKKKRIDKKLIKKKAIRYVIILAIILVFCLFQNNMLQVSDYTYSHEDIPEEFDGYIIVQISDLHNKNFLFDSYPVSKVEKCEPDIIVLTGDLIDSTRTDTEAAISFAEKMVEIAPTYYITGNHEYWVEEEVRLKLIEDLSDIGVICLDDEALKLSKDGSEITLIGLDEASLGYRVLSGITEETKKEDFTLLLAHEPQYIEDYSRAGVDLVLSGHAHGGQFRLPFIGGLYAPDQGLFPEYTEGLHEMDGTSMIISRGIGNSVIPLRLFNHPEIVCVTLEAK